MRKFTLLALSATIAVSGMAQNQEKSGMNLQKAKQIAAKVMARQATAGIVAPKAVVKMPKSINQYGYDNGAWTLETQNPTDTTATEVWEWRKVRLPTNR